MNWRRFFDFRELRDDPKPFLDHLEDLRLMLVKMAVVLGLMTAIAFAFQKTIVEIIERPLLAFDPDRTSLTNFGVADPLTIAIELSFYAGLVMAFPLLVLFLAEFVLPALTQKERRMLYPAAAASFGLFLTGVLFAYYCVLPPTLDYFFNYSKSLNWRPQWSVREYFSFTTQFVISFGLAFELPLAVLILVKLEILSYEVLQKTRAFAVLIILFLAAIITPTTDMLTLILMAGPMYLLYEGCILIAWFLERKARRQSLAANSTRG
ncbi:MAG TPA: twin-arginine translocase subunit TatC [Terrimicrobiaceae bacterium]|jgi:sec-independent protein translocase protein TatC|nr:twin-arginine translocase subunit TatC [Terrimicrobiaceae bacterium]